MAFGIIQHETHVNVHIQKGTFKQGELGVHFVLIVCPCCALLRPASKVYLYIYSHLEISTPEKGKGKREN